MFSFRRKSKKAQDTPFFKATPSLPDITSQGIPWPEDLVDIAAIRESPPPDGLHQGKPGEGVSISSLYMSNASPTFTNRKSVPKQTGRYSQRRARIPPTFNLMVVGGKQTGKTSLLRLLIETADVSPAATVDQRTAVERFFKNSVKSTNSIQTACVEIWESRFDRVLFSVIDTPGLDFQEGKELKLERQIAGIIRYIDTQFADTMNEESKVVRKSKGDQHIHLCIYMIDPSSIMTVAARRALSTLPTRTHSETTISLRGPPELVPDTSSGDESDDEAQDKDELTLSPVEIKVIRRLAERANVLPVIARADSLTDDKLQALKAAIRKDLSAAGLGFGVFGPADAVFPCPTKEAESPGLDDDNSADETNGNANGYNAGEETETEEDEERKSRPVIKLRAQRLGRVKSRSRSRRELSQVAESHHRPTSPDTSDLESVANVRFSAQVVAKLDLNSLMPFAIVTPEANLRRRRQALNGGQSASPSVADPSEDGHAPSVDAIPQSPVSLISSKHMPLPLGPPEDLKGVFVRKFRWGMIDALDPNHCDFSALRTAVLSTHMKLLKVHTKEVLYEKFRTEKLLVRRVTQQFTEEERQRLLSELGL
ncbi:hypothetical protein AX17_006278 [Amanita inopinata Kibby_2008]|nr:hypothetical protein AX17_006278 [Amanita inopinata Kibby_2008]